MNFAAAVHKKEKKLCNLFSNFLKLLSFCNCPFSISSLLFQLLVTSHLPFLLLYFFLLLKRFFSSSTYWYFLLPVPSPSSLPLPLNTVSDIFKYFSALTVWTVKIEDFLGVGDHVLNCKLASGSYCVDETWVWHRLISKKQPFSLKTNKYIYSNRASLKQDQSKM